MDTTFEAGRLLYHSTSLCHRDTAFEAHRLLYHSTLGSRACIESNKEGHPPTPPNFSRAKTRLKEIASRNFASRNWGHVLPCKETIQTNTGPRFSVITAWMALRHERREDTLNGLQDFLTENGSSEGKNLAVTGLCVPCRYPSQACRDHLRAAPALLYRNVQRFRGGLVFKAHRLLYH